MQPGRRYNYLVMGGALVACIVFAIANTVIDPWRVSPLPGSAKGLEPYRDISSQIRTGKAGLIRSGTWDVGLLGSSRVDNAWDPDAYGWQGERAVNLGASGGFIYETIGIARYFLAHENPELLVIGIDPSDLTSDLDTRPKSDYGSSPFGNTDTVNRELRYVVGLSTFEASMEVLKRAGSKTPGEYTPHGLRLRPEVAKSRSQMKFIRDQLRGASRERPGELNPEKAALIREFLEECAGKSVRIVLVLHPVHALVYARSQDRDHATPPFEPTRRFLLDAVEEANRLSPSGEFISYWDFFNFHPVHCELLPADKNGLERMKHWNDLGHYDVELGNSILAHVLGWEEQHPEWHGHGQRITSQTIDAYLETVRAGYEAYLEGPGAADVSWKESLATDAP